MFEIRSIWHGWKLVAHRLGMVCAEQLAWANAYPSYGMDGDRRSAGGQMHVLVDASIVARPTTFIGVWDAFASIAMWA